MDDTKGCSNPLTPELNLTAQRCLPRFFIGILNFQGLIARRLYKSFGFKGLIIEAFHFCQIRAKFYPTSSFQG
jgi:hypothetical protein